MTNNNTSNPLINQKYIAKKNKLDEILKNLVQFSFDINDKDLHQGLNSLRTSLNEPFQFMVIGEIKAGKSSFINALLKDDSICDVGAAPVTDRIVQIVHSGIKYEDNVNQYFRKIGMPVSILESIAIVDTPGTNTMEKGHQEITEEFIPNSDLIIFVLFAKNPHTQSAWELLDFVKEQWKKKIIFVLQQKDLTKPEELAENIKKVSEYAMERGIDSPKIYPVSADIEWDTINYLDKDIGVEPVVESGFNPVKDYISKSITDGNEKITSVLNTTKVYIDKVDQFLNPIKKQIQKNKDIIATIKSELSETRENSKILTDNLIQTILDCYEQVSIEKTEEFNSELGFGSLMSRTFSSMFNKKKALKSWILEIQTGFEKNLTKTIEEKSAKKTEKLVNSIYDFYNNLLTHFSEIDNENQTFNRKLLRDNQQQLNEIIFEIKSKLSDVLTDEFFNSILKTNPDKPGKRILSGGGIAVIGTVLMTVTNIAFVDFSGGILTGLGVLFAGGLFFINKNKIKKEFSSGLKIGKSVLKEILEEKLDTKMFLIYEEIENILTQFYTFVEKEEKELLPKIEAFKKIKNDLNNF